MVFLATAIYIWTHIIFWRARRAGRQGEWQSLAVWQFEVATSRRLVSALWCGLCGFDQSPLSALWNLHRASHLEVQGSLLVGRLGGAATPGWTR